MLHLYAIDPEVFKDKADFSLLIDRFGDPNPNRFILNTPRKRWFDQVRKTLDQLPIGEKSRAKFKELIFKLDKDKRLIPGRDGLHEDMLDWLSSFRNRALEEGADAIFVDEQMVDEVAQLFDWRDVATQGPPCWHDVLDRIQLTPEGFIGAIGSLISVSKEFHLVDPQLWPYEVSRNWTNTKPILEKIVERISLGAAPGRNCTLILNTCDKRNGIEKQVTHEPRFWQELWSKYKNVRIRFRVWPYETLNTGREHDRHFFTDRGAISFHNSFQVKERSTSGVQFVSPKTHQDLRKQYVHSTDEAVEWCWALPDYDHD